MNEGEPESGPGDKEQARRRVGELFDECLGDVLDPHRLVGGHQRREDRL